jgi:hypothetical protein
MEEYAMTVKPQVPASSPKSSNGPPTLTKPESDVIFGPPAYGIGHPNIILKKDYRDPSDSRWAVCVETTVPIDNEEEVRTWLDNGSIRALAESVIGQVPDEGDQVGARHMVAAAFGFELGPDNLKLVSRGVR